MKSYGLFYKTKPPLKKGAGVGDQRLKDLEYSVRVMPVCFLKTEEK